MFQPLNKIEGHVSSDKSASKLQVSGNFLKMNANIKYTLLSQCKSGNVDKTIEDLTGDTRIHVTQLQQPSFSSIVLGRALQWFQERKIIIIADEGRGFE